MPHTVGLVGVGIMGSRMCRNLLKAGFSVLVFDVSREALEAASAMDARTASDLPALGGEVSIVLCSLPDPSTVLQVLEGPDGLLAHYVLCEAVKERIQVLNSAGRA